MTSDSHFHLKQRIREMLDAYAELRGRLTTEETRLLEYVEEYEKHYFPTYLELWQQEQKKPVAASRASATILEMLTHQALDERYDQLATKYRVQKEKVEMLRRELQNYRTEANILNQLTVLNSIEIKLEERSHFVEND